MIELFLLLIASHFICDYVFQTDAIATGKNRSIDPCKFGVNWWYWMTTHAITHGVGVGIVTGMFWLGFLEAIFHWVIDFAKCEKAINLHQDQFLHILCKALIVYMYFK